MSYKFTDAYYQDSHLGYTKRENGTPKDDWSGLLVHTKNFTVEPQTRVNGNGYSIGWFEHKELGDDCCGCLLFEGKMLVNFDGVYKLSDEIINALESAGFDVTAMKECRSECSHLAFTGTICPHRRIKQCFSVMYQENINSF